MAIATDLRAALLLARGRADGLKLVGADLAAASRSFRAAAVALPALLALRLLDWSANGVPAQPLWALAYELLAYVIGWVGFALLSRQVAVALGRAALWPRYIIVWNWCNVIQYALMLAAALPTIAGVPDWIAETLWIVAVCWALWLEWLAARLTLEVTAMAAAALVVLDLAVGLALSVMLP